MLLHWVICQLFSDSLRTRLMHYAFPLLAVVFMPCFVCHGSHPCPLWVSVSEASHPRSLSWFCQLEIVTFFFDFSMVTIWTSCITSVLCRRFFYTDLHAQCVSVLALFFFLMFCWHFKDKDFCYLWISSSHREDFIFFKLIYSMDFDSKNILQILLYVWVLQFHSFEGSSYSKKLVWFVV